MTTLFAGCAPSEKKQDPIIYPSTAKVDTVDTYFGTVVPDPYRWLEDDRSEATAAWVKAQNEVTFGYLDKIPFREQVKARLEKLWNYEKVGAPFKQGDYYYFYKNDGLQNQYVVYRKKGMDGAVEVFLDPNTFSADGTISLAGMSFTQDGSLCAYQISEGGSDWRKVIVKNTNTGEMVEDTLRDVKFSGIAWKGTKGFYYSSYDKPKEGSTLSGLTQYHKLYWHTVGTPQSEDVLIFGGDKQPRRYIGASLTEDERFLVISAATSTSGNELYIQDLSQENSPIVTVVDNFENNHYVLANEGDRLLIHTNWGAPNNRVVETTAANPVPSTWKDVIAESEHVMEAGTAGGKIFANYMIDAKTAIKQFDMKGTLERDIELPGIGTAGGFGGELEDKEIYYSFTSFLYPSAIFSYEIATGKSTLYNSPKIDFNPEEYVTEQVFYTSKDGTKVPMFITYKKGLERNGKNPTYLYAYGGFNVSLTPSFSIARLVWLENGGIYAQPNLRGGGEYGEKWHVAGTKMQKQNVFDDFIAAGEYLIKEGYTSSDYLAIAGGSNGGLLVGATMTQRPDLAKVAFPAVGVMDMLRYHKFTAGAGWAFDYGTSEDSKEMFEYLRNYSPVHALKPGTSYPATMVTTADHDDRVVPAHSFKFAATLQEHHVGDNPVLIRIETNAGHGAGTPTSKQIEAAADIYSFAWYNMGITPEFKSAE
ncbi:prolyl oligopeptidase family serine peptidase [Cytophagales bacterium LB-30]|uniref:prolyl oligopeptidase n=1 Tax=Shiella aurantiaca TaxID=3058365 RepID=A0ABT8F699_9BACT|nr:prolyl oligopeptidase family serine peptidase [Shiella aurantiaca]MDN4165501.1 prolyl oligopeptidase family serine peptidase [Shiella aurantiaca]